MISEFGPYLAYKNSGVGWLRTVPEHWAVTPVKQRYTIQLGKMLQKKPNSSSDFRVPYLRAKDVQWFNVRTADASRMWSSRKDVEQFGISTGDLLVCEGGEGGRCGILRGGPEGYIIQNALHRVRPREQDSNEFLQYVLHSVATTGWFKALNSKATIAHFTKRKFGALSVPIPPVSEQHAIVRYLDHADRRIRRYIRAKERLIELLEEQKQAIIHQAVTGQIDVRTGQPYPAYKDSGVEWLGKVPLHWETRRLKTLLRTVDRRSSTGDETLLSLRRDHGVVIYSEHFARPPQGRTLVGYKLVEVGQLVVNRLQANNGLVFCSGVGGVVSPDYSVFEMKAPIEMQYLSDLLRTAVYRSHFRRGSTGLGTGTAGFLRLYDDVFLSTKVFLPPVQEQILILSSLANATANIDGLIDNQQRELQLIDEYRTRLIADVVTGKLDVRKAAIVLPEVDVLADDATLNETVEPVADNLQVSLQDAHP